MLVTALFVTDTPSYANLVASSAISSAAAAVHAHVSAMQPGGEMWRKDVLFDVMDGKHGALVERLAADPALATWKCKDHSEAHGQTLLHAAVRFANPTALTLLLANGCVGILAKDKAYKTPLEPFSAQHGRRHSTCRFAPPRPPVRPPTTPARARAAHSASILVARRARTATTTAARPAPSIPDCAVTTLLVQLQSDTSSQPVSSALFWLGCSAKAAERPIHRSHSRRSQQMGCAEGKRRLCMCCCRC